MLPGFYNPPFVKPDVSAAPLTAVSDVANSTSYSFTGVDFGSPVSDRIIHLVVASTKAASGSGWSSATIGGVAATILTQGASSELMDVAHMFAAVPTGSSGNISLTSVATRNQVVVMPYRIVDWTGQPASATQVEIQSTSAASSVVRTVPGFVIGGSIVESTNDIAWSGLSEDYEMTIEGRRASFASLVNSAAGTLNVTASSSGTFWRRLSLCQWI